MWEDRHGHVTSLVRKKSRIMVDDVMVAFDEEACELIFARKDTKHLLKANEFELENHSLPFQT